MKLTRQTALLLLAATSFTFLAAASTTGGPQPPSFVSHVTDADVEQALKVAQRRHDQTIQQALRQYDTDSVPGDIDPVVKETTFQKYAIHAPGALPDFGGQEGPLERSIYVTDPPLLSAEECAMVIQNAEEFVGDKPWGLLPSGQYDISGFWVKDSPVIREWFNKLARQRLFPLFQKLYPSFVEDPGDLCVDSAYLFKYNPETGRRTEVHTDCGCLSFTIALNDSDEYEGGGTFFEGLQGMEGGSKVLEMNQGQITMRPGGVKHAGCAISSGTRYIIGGFCMNRKKVENVRMLLNKDAATTDEEQRKLVEAALVLNPALDTTYNMLANNFIKGGDKAKAKLVLETGLEKAHPGSSELAYALNDLYLQEKNYAKAIDCLKICLEMDDCDIDALNALAHAYSAQGDSQHERECYERIIKAPAAAAKRVASAYCNLGVLSEGTDSEIDYYRKSLEIVPEAFAAQYSLGAAYASRKRWADAIGAFRKAVSYADEDESENLALQGLYKATRFMVAEGPQPTSREEVAARFQEIMGIDNYQKLVISTQQKKS